MAKCKDPKTVRSDIFIRSYVFNGPFIRATKQFYKNRLQASCTKKENNTFYKNRLQGFCREKTLHCFRLIFPRLFSHPWKVCLWRSLVWKKHQNHTSKLSKCPPSESWVSKKIGNSKYLGPLFIFQITKNQPTFCSSYGLASPCPACACHRRLSRCCSIACCSCSQLCCCSFYLACSNCCPGRPAPAPRGKGSIDSSSQENSLFSVLISEHFSNVSRFKYKLPWQRQRFDKDINRALQPWSPF